MSLTVQYYDLILAGVLASIVLGLSVAALTTLRVVQTVPVASAAAIALILHGLFVEGPLDDPADLTDEVETLN